MVSAYIIVLAAVFIIIFGIGIAIAVIVGGKNKESPSRKKEQCTISLKGTLLRVNQVHSMMPNGDYDAYDYVPVIRYEYDGQTYETEYPVRENSFLWEKIGLNTQLDVFINPENANDIYVLMPNEIGEKHNRKIRYFLIAFFIIWIAVIIICIVFPKG